MICTLCFTPFDERDSLGSRDGLCQDCWESACSEEWWERMAALTSFDELSLQSVPNSECEASG